MSIEERYEEVREPIVAGRNRGYLLHDQISDSLPPGISSDELNELMGALTRAGIEAVDSEDAGPDSALLREGLGLVQRSLSRVVTSSRRGTIRFAYVFDRLVASACSPAAGRSISRSASKQPSAG